MVASSAQRLVLDLCLACWMGPLGVALHFVWFGSGLGCFVGIFLVGLLRLVGFIASWRWSVRVALGMVLSIFSLPVLLRLVSGLAWSRPGWPLLSNLAGPVQHFRAAILDTWRNKVGADLCGRAGFRGGPLLDVHGSLQLLNSSHVKERGKALLRSIMVGDVWNGFLLSQVRGQTVPCRFCGAPDGDGHLFWECTF